MLENIPSLSDMKELLGQSLFEVWQELCSVIDEKYEMERLWNTGGKNWTYEYKYRRGGKTLCCLLKGNLTGNNNSGVCKETNGICYVCRFCDRSRTEVKFICE